MDSLFSRLEIESSRAPKSIPDSAFTMALGSWALACAVPPKARMNSGKASSLLRTLVSSWSVSRAGASSGDIIAAITRSPK